MPRIVAVVELVNYVLEGKTKALLVAEPGCGFRRQTWVSRCASLRCLVLLRLDGLAFPSPSHLDDYNRPPTEGFTGRGFCAGVGSSAPSHLGNSLFGNPTLRRKPTISLRIEVIIAIRPGLFSGVLFEGETPRGPVP